MLRTNDRSWTFIWIEVKKVLSGGQTGGLLGCTAAYRLHKDREDCGCTDEGLITCCHHPSLCSCIPASPPPCPPPIPPLALSASLTFRSGSAVTTSVEGTTASGESVTQQNTESSFHLILNVFHISYRADETEELTNEEPALSSSQDGAEGETRY